MPTNTDTNTTTAQTSQDTGSNTTAEERGAFFTDARERLSDAVSTAVDAVKNNPKTAAAIVAGTTAAVAGAAYGATKRKTAGTKTGKSATGAAAKRSTAKK